MKSGPGLGARKKPCSRKAHPLFPLQEARVPKVLTLYLLSIAHHGDAQNLSPSGLPCIWSQALLSCGEQHWCLSWEQDASCSAVPKVCRPRGYFPSPWQVGEARQSRALVGSCSSPMGAPPLHHNLSCVPSIELRNQPQILWEGENLSTTIFLPGIPPKTSISL